MRSSCTPRRISKKKPGALRTAAASTLSTTPFGKSTFDKSLGCLRPRGTLALFGQASGAVGPLDLQRLNSGGSLFVTRPSLVHHTLTREELLGRSKDVFDMVGSGMLNVRIDREYPLSAATEAHSRLEGRRSTGKLLLIP